MQVTYAINGERFALETSAEEDLSELAVEIERHVRQQHPALGENSHLAVVIADRLLNDLSDDREELTLGELTRTG